MPSPLRPHVPIDTPGEHLYAQYRLARVPTSCRGNLAKRRVTALRRRVTGQIICGTIAGLLLVAALVTALFTSGGSDAYRGLQAITYAVLAVAAAAGYRYFRI